jgi:peroxiredoxin
LDWVLVGLGVFTLLTLWVVLFQVVRQQGRLLLRLDSVEQRLALVSGGITSAAAATNGGAPQAAPSRPVQPTSGIPVGAALSPFRLPSLSGESVELADFRGKRALLVHWSPGCGFCERIASDLAGLQGDLRKRKTELVFASYGDVEANRGLAERHGLDCPILLQDESGSVEAFRGLGTPAAYLLDEGGRVAAPLAVGANEVPAFAREVAQGRKQLGSERSLAESRLERDGLKAGTPAPSFVLPDLGGATVSLEEYRGRRLLLVFTDPGCGPCDALAPELARLHEEHGEARLALLMVGRGDQEANRRKATQHGIGFPYLLQDHWQLSKQYGIFATPVAFLIDAQGVIARDVARGQEEISALAREELAAEPVAAR